MKRPPLPSVKLPCGCFVDLETSGLCIDCEHTTWIADVKLHPKDDGQPAPKPKPKRRKKGKK